MEVQTKLGRLVIRLGIRLLCWHPHRISICRWERSKPLFFYGMIVPIPAHWKIVGHRCRKCGAEWRILG